jgi:hypothetical protein
VGAPDLAILNAHNLHGCAGVVDTRRTRWGALKLHR